MVVFRHLVGTPHRIALFNQIDKLFDEHVLLGTGIASKEMLRQAVFHHKNDFPLTSP
jgi:transformation/transcription domain-associated protein